MYAYPVAGAPSIARAVELSKRCEFYLRLDNAEGAESLNLAAEKADTVINYTVIIDCGFHRFGLPPELAAPFVTVLQRFRNLRFCGISTHPGQIYALGSSELLPQVCAEERSALRTAYEQLTAAGHRPEIVSSGSTPTLEGSIADPLINMYHPGNYVLNDVIQTTIGTAKLKDCALTVYATVISHPSERLYIVDAGAKCLGLDKGAHGTNVLAGFGAVKGHPDIDVVGLSEEVGKLHANGPTEIGVGSRVEIIPNHACSAANCASYLFGCRGNSLERKIAVDMRGNSTGKGF